LSEIHREIERSGAIVSRTMKSTQDRQRDERERKLAEIRRQLDQGTLRIRQMTPEERRANPPRPPDAQPSRRRRRA
jgi:hypothetical protein